MKNILVIGDIILDKYVTGSVNRLSPEAPVPILDITNIYYRLGGSTNVARNLKALGANVWVIGRIGNDKEGQIVKEQLKTEQIQIDLLYTDPLSRTTLKTRYIGNTQHLLRADNEDKTSFCYNTELLEILYEDLERHFKYFDAIIVSDYNKGVVCKKVMEKLHELNKNYRKIVAVDTHKNDVSMFAGVSAITPNQKEMEEISRTKLKNPNDYPLVCEKIAKEYSLEYVLLTLSEKGLFLWVANNPEKTKTSESAYFPATTRNPVDVTGCGDTVIATFTFMLSCGLSPVKSAELANVAAGIVVQKEGTATCSLAELETIKGKLI